MGTFQVHTSKYVKSSPATFKCADRAKIVLISIAHRASELKCVLGSMDDMSFFYCHNVGGALRGAGGSSQTPWRTTWPTSATGRSPPPYTRHTAYSVLHACAFIRDVPKPSLASSAHGHFPSSLSSARHRRQVNGRSSELADARWVTTLHHHLRPMELHLEHYDIITTCIITYLRHQCADLQCRHIIQSSVGPINGRYIGIVPAWPMSSVQLG